MSKEEQVLAILQIALDIAMEEEEGDLRENLKTAIGRVFEGIEIIEGHYKERRRSGEAMFFAM